MKLRVIHLGDAKVKVEVEATQDTVRDAFHKAYQNLNTRVTLKGFRSGKAPLEYLRKRFAESVKADVCESLMNDSLQKLVHEHALTPIGIPQVQDLHQVLSHCSEESPLSFSLVFEEKPRVKLANYKNLRVDVHQYVYTQEHVDAQLDVMRYKRLELKEKSPQTIGHDDVIEFQYHFGLLSPDERLDELYRLDMGREDVWFDVHKSRFLGMGVGESGQFACTIPEEYKEGLRGKSGYLFVKVLSVFSKRIPDLDDEFAKDYHFETLADLRQDLEKQLQRACDDKRKQELYDACLQQIIKRSSFEVGKDFIDERVEQEIHQLEQHLARENYSLDNYLQANALSSLDALKNAFHEDITQRIKHQLVREAIVQAENIKVSELQVDARILEYAQYKNVSSELMREHLVKRQEIGFIYQDVLTSVFVECFFRYSQLHEQGSVPLFDLKKVSNS